MFRIAVLNVLLLPMAAMAEEPRVWRIEIQGTYDGIDNDKVRIKNAAGKTITINISMLSAPDKQYIQQKLGLGGAGREGTGGTAPSAQTAPPKPAETRTGATSEPPRQFTFLMVTGTKVKGRAVSYGADSFSIGRRAGKVYVGRKIDGKQHAAAYENLKGYDKALVDYALLAKGFGTVDEYTKKVGLHAQTIKYPTVTISTGAEAEQTHPIHMFVDKQADALRTLHARWTAANPVAEPPKEVEEGGLKSFIDNQ